MVLVLAWCPAAHAGPVGTLGFTDLVGGSTDTGDLNTATTFTIGLLASNGTNSGIFAGLPTQFIGATGPFSTATGSNTTLTFSSSGFGTFTSSTATSFNPAAGALNLLFDGTWTPDSSGLAPPGAYAAGFTFMATQSPPHTGQSIQDSGTFSIPAASLVPEPATFGLFALGAVGLAGYQTLRRRRS
jgi:hypothetical protein